MTLELYIIGCSIALGIMMVDHDRKKHKWYEWIYVTLFSWISIGITLNDTKRT